MSCVELTTPSLTLPLDGSTFTWEVFNWVLVKSEGSSVERPGRLETVEEKDG